MTRRHYISRLIRRCYRSLEQRDEWNRYCADGQCIDLGAVLVALDLCWQVRGYWATGRLGQAERTLRRLREFLRCLPDEDEVEVDDWEHGGES